MAVCGRDGYGDPDNVPGQDSGLAAGEGNEKSEGLNGKQGRSLRVKMNPG